MSRTRRTYTPEFKAEAVRLVTEQGYAIAEFVENSTEKPNKQWTSRCPGVACPPQALSGSVNSSRSSSCQLLRSRAGSNNGRRCVHCADSIS